jgi:iron(III) transport system ATP-binding protein
VALARAIVPRPAVMLMDEPFSGLDVQLRDSVQEETLALLRETRATSMIVTHHPEEAMRLGDRIAVMHAGRVVQQGRAEDLYHHPVALFVARLFSEINEVRCTVRNGRVALPAGDVPAPGFSDGETVILCIRERGIALSPAAPKPEAAHGGLAGRVLDVKFLGDASLIEVGLSGFEAPLRVRVGDGHGLRRGSEITARIDLGSVLVFAAPVEAGGSGKASEIKA